MTSKRGGGRRTPSSPSGFDFDFDDDTEARHGKSALEKMADLLARKEHSEQELRRKLSLQFEPDEVEDAIQLAKDKKFLLPPEELAGRVADRLSRKGKGAGFINQHLEAKGLPPVATDLSEEVRKGLELVATKLAKQGPFDYEEQRKIERLLAARGFAEETVEAVIRAAGGRASEPEGFESPERLDSID